MKPIENPPRLLDHPEFGSDWSVAAADEMAADRLAACGEEVARQVANVSTGLSAAGAAAGTSASTGATVAKVTLPILALGGMLMAYLSWSDSPTKEEIEEPLPPPMRAVVEAPALAPAADKPSGLMKSDPRPRPAPSKPRNVPEKVEPADSRPSLLPEQLRLFRQAQRAAGTGDYPAALLLLQRLESEFPDSPIDAETRLAKAEVLVRAQRYAQATVEIQKLLLEPSLVGKRATLYQMLGDSWMNRDRCDRAVGAFNKALQRGLEPDQEAAVRAAMKNCAAR